MNVPQASVAESSFEIVDLPVFISESVERGALGCFSLSERALC